jgi:hypothetical protein
MKGIVLAVALALVAAPAVAQNGGGNGAPSGSHYNLNIIGHDNCPGGSFTGSNRHAIAVFLNYDDDSQNGSLYKDLVKDNKIFLAAGADFEVLDGNACDGDGARFQLPGDVSMSWEVYARALGPGGQADITTCAVDTMGTEDPADDLVVCDPDPLELKRIRGTKPVFQNVSRDLLFIDVDLDGDGTLEEVPLFGAELYDYFWDYDNNGLRLAQLRFYPKP